MKAAQRRKPSLLSFLMTSSPVPCNRKHQFLNTVASHFDYYYSIVFNYKADPRGQIKHQTPFSQTVWCFVMVGIKTNLYFN